MVIALAFISSLSDVGNGVVLWIFTVGCWDCSCDLNIHLRTRIARSPVEAWIGVVLWMVIARYCSIPCRSLDWSCCVGGHRTLVFPSEHDKVETHKVVPRQMVNLGNNTGQVGGQREPGHQSIMHAGARHLILVPAPASRSSENAQRAIRVRSVRKTLTQNSAFSGFL